MKKYLLIVLLVGVAYSQGKENKDSTFVILKSGELKQVQNTHASIQFVTPLVMKFEITDTDSMKYDIYDIESIQDSKGKTVIGGKTIFILKFVKSIFQTLVLVGFYWIIIN